MISTHLVLALSLVSVMADGKFYHGSKKIWVVSVSAKIEVMIYRIQLLQ